MHRVRAFGHEERDDVADGPGVRRVEIERYARSYIENDGAEEARNLAMRHSDALSQSRGAERFA